MAAFGIVGPAYEARSKYQDGQRCINLYPEIDQTPGAKAVIALLGTPGLAPFATLAANTEVRGAWVLPGQGTALCVAGNGCYLVDTVGNATKVGTLLTDSGQVSIRDNGIQAVMVDGPYGYRYTIADKTFAQITDDGFYGADRVAFIDGWFLFNRPGTQQFYVSNLYATTFDATKFASKEGNSDHLVCVIENQRQAFLLGEETSEVWYDTGGLDFPFSRIQGAFLQIGCAAAQSAVRFGGSIAWLATSPQAQVGVVTLEGYTPARISNPAVEYAWSQYQTVSDAFAYTYGADGHTFYVLTFPSADKTWVYDNATKMWHERASFDTVTNTFHRHRGNCMIEFAGHTMVGDYQSGKLHQLNSSVYTDDGQPIVRLRRAPHIQSDHNRVFFARLQIEFEPGVGLPAGQGQDPQAMLRWSDDGGSTWSSEHWASIGKIGAYTNRAIWRRLGSARDRVFEVRVSDPVKCNIINATLLAEPGRN